MFLEQAIIVICIGLAFALFVVGARFDYDECYSEEGRKIYNIHFSKKQVNIINKCLAILCVIGAASFALLGGAMLYELYHV